MKKSILVLALAEAFAHTVHLFVGNFEKIMDVMELNMQRRLKDMLDKRPHSSMVAAGQGRVHAARDSPVFKATKSDVSLKTLVLLMEEAMGSRKSTVSIEHKRCTDDTMSSRPVEPASVACGLAAGNTRSARCRHRPMKNDEGKEIPPKDVKCAHNKFWNATAHTQTHLRCLPWAHACPHMSSNCSSSQILNH